MKTPATAQININKVLKAFVDDICRENEYTQNIENFKSWGEGTFQGLFKYFASKSK